MPVFRDCRRLRLGVKRLKRQPVLLDNSNNIMTHLSVGIYKDRRSRRGSIFPIFIVALLLVTTVTGSLIKATMLQQKRVRLTNTTAQTEWLATSGLDRAASRLALSDEYVGEEWNITSQEMGGKHSAIVILTVESISDSKKQITATATYPANSDQRTKVTRKRIVSTVRVTN
jgi:hypothetical protein